MQLNKLVTGAPSDVLLAVFPLVASVWELFDAIAEIAETCLINGWVIHIPFTGIVYFLLVLGLTFGQYALANSIAQKGGWCHHKVNSGLELAMLAFSLFT
jgi:hypothetical protein